MSFSVTAATQVICETITEEHEHQESLIAKPAISLIINLFQNIRFCFRYMRYGNIYNNQANFLSLSSGHLLNIACGENYYIKMAAQCVLIANLLSEGIEQQKKVLRCYNKLMDIIENRYPAWHPTDSLTAETSAQFNAGSRLLSPSSARQIHTHVDLLRTMATKLVYRLYRLACEIFKLCLLIAETIDSLSLSPSAASLAVCHLFSNLSQQLNFLASNGQELLQKIQQHRHVIDKLFYRMGTSYSAETLLAGLRPLVQTFVATNNCVANVCTVANGTLWQVIQEGIFGFMSVIGLSGLIPESLVPPLLLPAQVNSRLKKPC